MALVCFYFQVHQPYRIRRYTYFENSSLKTGRQFDYFDESKNAEVAKKVAHKCYLPTNELMLSLINQHKNSSGNGSFKIAYSLTGIFLEQMERYAPEVIDSFRRLNDTGCVEFLSETYHHSLASLYNENEFRSQVSLHLDLMQHLFNIKPNVFRNTELIYDDRIGHIISNLGFSGVLAEGADHILNGASPNVLRYLPNSNLKLLLKNYRLSDDIAFRFSNPNWEGYPLTPEKFAASLHNMSSSNQYESCQVVNLFMDYETFGEHQWASTGIFDFMKGLPSAVTKDSKWSFATPSEVLQKISPVGNLSYVKTSSWADKKRDLSAWQGNHMQIAALDSIYKLGNKIQNLNNAHYSSIWRKLQTSDHFYYMSTKESEDGDVHAYFSPYDSPYDAFINFMNVIKDFREEIDRVA